MNLVDANVLLSAVNRSDPRHERARDWLDAELSGGTTVGFAWIVLLAFLRLSTRVGLFPRPLATADALDIVRAWLAQPPAVVVQETSNHLEVLADLLGPIGVGGNLATDAHLAALSGVDPTDGFNRSHWLPSFLVYLDAWLSGSI